MRLTGGEARGRRIRGPKGLGIRPTSDRVRKALFDILGARVEGADFLDACAGSGAVGIEALSRGARRTVFLERDPQALELVRRNLEVGHWSGSSEIIAGDALRSLAALAGEGRRFGILFLDPPYDDPLLPRALEAAAAVMGPAALFIVEHRSAHPVIPPESATLRQVRSYRYGDTSLTLFRAAPGDSGG